MRNNLPRTLEGANRSALQASWHNRAKCVVSKTVILLLGAAWRVLTAASPGWVIQHLPHQKAVTTEASVCVIRLLLLSQKEIGCCICLLEGPLCVSSLRCLWVFCFLCFFMCIFFFNLSVETMQDIGSLFLILTRYWFIISDSCDIRSFNSPLRSSFPSWLEVEAGKNSTENDFWF